MKNVDWSGVTFCMFLCVLTVTIGSCVRQMSHDAHEYEMARIAQKR